MAIIPGLKPVNPSEQAPRPEYRAPLLEVVHRLPAQEAAPAFFRPASPEMPAPAAIIEQRNYDNLGAMLQQMFAEADALPPQAMLEESPREEREGYATDREVYHDFLSIVMKGMKDSGLVTAVREKAKAHPDEIGEQDIKDVYRAYELSLRKALRIMKPDLNPPQRTDVQEAIAHLDWSYKDVIANHVMAMSDGSENLQYDTTDFLLLLNPKARKIEYTTSEEARRLVTHFGSRLDKDTIARDTKRAIPAHVDGVFDEPQAQAA